MNAANAIEVRDLQMRFRGCDALCGIDLKVPTGTVFALLGENGAGKTTLIRILTGFLSPTSGTARVLGLDPTVDAVKIRSQIGYVADAPSMYDWMKVDEIGWFTAGFYPDGYLDRYRELIAKFEVPMSRKIKALSKGQRAKVALSLAIAHDPSLLILDEPTSGLDPLVRREFLESMVDRAATGRTVLLSSHQINEVERVADHVAIIHQGKVTLIGSLNELRDSISEVTVKLKDPLISLPILEPSVRVIHEQTSGRQRRLIVCDLQEQHLRQLEESYGVFDVASRPASLEELFIACTRGSNASQGLDNAEEPSSIKQESL